MNPATGMVRIACDADDENAARARVLAMGYAILDVRRRGLAARQAFPLVLFSQELVALLDAGLSLVEVLQVLSERHQEGRAQGAIRQVLDALYQGRAFSAALEAAPEAFPPLYVATVRASEKTGNLGEALSRYIAYQAQVEGLRAKIATASIYPALLLTVGGAVTLFLLGYVVPKFAAIYADIGREQPASSRLLMGFGAFVNGHGPLMAVLFIMTVCACVLMFAHPALRAAVMARLATLPGIGERLRVIQLARLYRTAGMLLRGGVPAVTALDMVGNLLPAELRERLARAITAVREGRPLSQAMASQGLDTPVAARLLRVGERTGDMGAMMERIAVFHDEEIARWIDRTMRLFEPLLMAFIGVTIGGIVLSLYMPIFELAGSLQ